jgi:hypothetical protein
MTQRAKARQRSNAAHQTKTPKQRSGRGAATKDAAQPRSAKAKPATATLPAKAAATDGAPARSSPTHSPVRRWMWLNGLALIMFGAFVIFAVLQSVFGWHVRNEELVQAGEQADTFWYYLRTGHFGEAIFENGESEFLQMGAYVLLTAHLVQRGSPESKPLDQDDRANDYPENATVASPALSRARGLPQALYRNSLSLVMFALFAGTCWLAPPSTTNNRPSTPQRHRSARGNSSGHPISGSNPCRTGRVNSLPSAAW